MNKVSEIEGISMDAEKEINHGEYTILVGLRDKGDEYKAYGNIYKGNMPFSWNIVCKKKMRVEKTEEAVNDFVEMLKHIAKDKEESNETAEKHLESAI